MSRFQIWLWLQENGTFVFEHLCERVRVTKMYHLQIIRNDDSSKLPHVLNGYIIAGGIYKLVICDGNGLFRYYFVNSGAVVQQ